MRTLVGGVVAAASLVVIPPVFAQSPTGTWNGLTDRFQIDTGYFRITADAILRYNGPQGGSGQIDFTKDLGENDSVNTFWVDGTWRVGRRHQLKLAFTRSSQTGTDHTLQRDFSWGGETYSAGLTANSSTSSDILAGYYRFAAFRNERFEIGPTIGFGYLWLKAEIQATGTVSTPGGSESRTLDASASTGSVTGAFGGYANAWPAKRLALRGDFLYIKLSPGDSTGSVTDWRLAADYYFFPNAGLGAQYKYYKYTYDRGIVASQLGGELTFKGFQVFLSFLF